MNSAPQKYGLIGYPLSHSFSPIYFKQFFEKEVIDWATYDLFPIKDLTMITELMESVDGLNVTIPYKQDIMNYLDVIDEEALAIGAVNCIHCDNGKNIGYNTDVYGFRESLLDFLNGTYIRNALIFGDGGAAKAVRFVLNQLDITHTTVSRSKGDIRYDQLNEDIIESSRLLINTTPLGTFPNVNSKPDIPYKAINNTHFLFDLVYNPEKTLFLNNGLANGAKVENGNRMLILQAQKSWDIWTNNQTQ